MSIEAIHWVLNTAPIPADRRDASSLTVVLVGLANHADPDGRNAFPALSTLARYTRLSERSVRYALRGLEELGLIRASDPGIVAAYVRRADRRPNGYDLAMPTLPFAVDNSASSGDNSSGNDPSARQSLPLAEQDGGQPTGPRGAGNDPAGGRACPRTILEPSKNRPPRTRTAARAHATPTTLSAPPPPPCGQCDARPGDRGISTRLVAIPGTGQVRRCPRCHPTEIAANTPQLDLEPRGR
ncbi:helix-turn-helix domain-containing protein [Amycolatopsis sp. NBC_01480]|uniref:helix-turn-helix domain-containing protein n=1 Tax=Amycolatopsis sp. NBC_01480 TaxID=2903562 RepID=UPI002E2A68BF|nr:helix-turn-helix domain-containing protein [Amycolatopsis sp. NBC_01480]